MEFLEGAESVDKIKKSLPRGMTLKNYFELTFGESYSFFYAKAVQHFVRSLVGYSLLTYLVQVLFAAILFICTCACAPAQAACVYEQLTCLSTLGRGISIYSRNWICSVLASSR